MSIVLLQGGGLSRRQLDGVPLGRLRGLMAAWFPWRVRRASEQPGDTGDLS